jgi:transcriptional regulator with XRE-family HTH domain
MSRLRQVREARGRDPHDLARGLGISSASYFDLEGDPSRLAAELSVAELRHLSRELDVPVRWLLQRDPPAVQTLEDLIERLRAHLRSTGQSPEAFADEVGWDVPALLADPAAVAAINGDGLEAICAPLGLDWIDVVEVVEFPASDTRKVLG